MIQIADVTVEENRFQNHPGTYVVRGGIKITCQRECMPHAREETIEEVRREIWQMVYGEIALAVEKFANLAFRKSELTASQEVLRAGEELLKSLKLPQHSKSTLHS